MLAGHTHREAENCTGLNMVELLKHLTGQNQFFNLGQIWKGAAGFERLQQSPQDRG